MVANSKRTYVSIFDALGSIGGINGVIIVVMLMLYGPINEKKRREYMTRKIYSLIGVKEEDLEKGMQYIADRNKRLESTEPQETDPQARTVVIKRPSFWSRCCFCCRKKTDQQIEWEQRVEKAHQRILDSLDVLSIVRNFNQLKVLTHFFFGERHFDLAQYVGFDLWQEECDSREKRRKEELDSEAISKSQLSEERRNLRRVRISKRIVTEKQRFNHWLDYMKKKHIERTDEKEELVSGLNDELDEFFYQKLCDPANSHDNFGMVDIIRQLMREEIPGRDIQVPQDDEVEGRHYPNHYMENERIRLQAPQQCESDVLRIDRNSTPAPQVQHSPIGQSGNSGPSPTELILALVGQAQDDGNEEGRVQHFG